jgi:hypothetical protein
MMLRLGPLGAIVLATWSLMAGAAQAQPTLNAPTVVGADINFTWSGLGGSTSYDLQAALAPGGPYIATFNVGNVTTIGVTAPAVGVYYVRIVALPSGTPSNEVQVVVTSLVAPPAVPTPVQTFRNGPGNVILAWAPGSGGGPVTGYLLRAGTTPGGAELGVIPTNLAGLATGGVPAGTYYLGIAAVNAGGISAEAAETALVMPAGGACDAPPAPSLTTTAWGSYLTAIWTGIPGAGAYLFSYNGPGFVGQLGFGGNQTSFIFPGLPQGTWAFGVQAQFSCGSVGGVGQSNLTVDGSSLKLTPREPDPPAGQALPTPGYAQSVVNQVAAQFPGDLARSCGNNTWLFRLVNELRKRDKRWGLNWKRANFGDMSQDIITFNWGPDPDEGTLKMRAYDVIGGHCGSRPGPNFEEKTSPAPPAYNSNPPSAIWTLIPYIEAGFIP